MFRRFGKIFLYIWNIIKQPRHIREVGKNNKGKKLQIAISSPKLFLLALFLVSYTATSMFCLINNTKPCSKHSIYKAQNEIVPILEGMARSEREKAVKDMPEKTPIAVDGSWATRRNSSFCVIEEISVVTKKIIDFEIFIRNNGKKLGNYMGPSNLMEAVGLENAQEAFKYRKSVFNCEMVT